MVVTKVKQIKSVNKLAEGIKYIEDGAKTIGTELIDSDVHFPIKIVNGQPVSQLVSGHLVIDVEAAYSEFMQLKQLANLEKGRPINNEELVKTDVLAHHVIQSFSPEDNLTPEQVHEIGRKTALELIGGSHQFVIATHMDKGHLHNHIYINSTNSVTLNKFRWQKGTKKALEQISDKYADLAGAKILDRQNQFGHKEYSAYQKENVFKLEIKSRLEFLLKHATSIQDFQEKAKALNLAVDFSGKYAKYKLLDRDQKRNTRDSTLSKKGRYSLKQIEECLAKNEIVHSVDVIKSEYDKLAEKLSNSRKEIALKIENELLNELKFLNMEDAKLKVQINKIEKMTNDGYDEVEFFISTNVGQDLKPLSKIASGGEVSRVMLALKVIFSKVDNIPILIFDEIDTGIGGETVRKIALKLKEIGDNTQIISITHSPVIASKASQQFYIEKYVENSKTISRVKKLSAEERIKEIGRMLVGEKINNEVLEIANKMLNEG